MKIISWNVNGIRSALSKNFREFAAAENPDIVCVQETKIYPAAAEKLDLPFKYRYFHCAERAGYSGVAIFSNVEPLSVSREALCGSPDEGRFLSADFGKFVLTSIYAPNSQDALKRIDYKHAWNTAFAAKMAESRRNIVCGDFNVAHCEIDIARPRENEGNAGFSQTERDLVELPRRGEAQKRRLAARLFSRFDAAFARSRRRRNSLRRFGLGSRPDFDSHQIAAPQDGANAHVLIAY